MKNIFLFLDVRRALLHVVPIVKENKIAKMQVAR